MLHAVDSRGEVVLDSLIPGRKIPCPAQMWQWGCEQGVVGSKGETYYTSSKGRPQTEWESHWQRTTAGTIDVLEDWKRRKHSRYTYEMHANMFGVVSPGSSQWSLMAWETMLSTVLQQPVLGSGTNHYFHYWISNMLICRWLPFGKTCR